MSRKNEKHGEDLREQVLKELHYRSYKILLRPELFQTPEGFEEYWHLASGIAREEGLSTKKVGKKLSHLVRIVTFFDTANFDLYQEGFILRKRRFVKDDFPVEEVEHTLKFRHPDLELATSIDMTPTIKNHARIKFKEVILPDADATEMRQVFSNNIVYKIKRTDPIASIGELEEYVPAVSRLGLPADTPLVRVNDFMIGEISVDLGHISFEGYQAEADMSIWRHMGTGEILTAEFSWQSKFPAEFAKPLRDSERAVADGFYMRLLRETSDWVLRGSTKTRIVYEYGGRTINCHE